MKPSVFTEHPFDSIFKKMEYEVIAKNIMAILKRTGDVFRPLTWEEYKLERLKDKGFVEGEKDYFDKVISYCANEERARCFSPTWTDAYIKEFKRIDKLKPIFTRAQALHMLEEYDRELKLDTHAYTKPCNYTVKQWFDKKY